MNKKAITSSLLFILAFTYSFAQNPGAKFTLHGKLNSVHMDSVLIAYTGTTGKPVQEVKALVNDEFTVSGTIASPVSAYIFFKIKDEVVSPRDRGARTKQFYLEPGTITLSGDPLKPSEMEINGSKTQVEMDELTALTSPIRDEEKPIIDELNKEKDHDKASAIRDKLEPYSNRIKKVSYAWFLKHPNSYVTADQMRFYVASIGLDSIKRIYDDFNEELKQSDRGKDLLAEIKNMEAGSPGNMAAAFSRADINGKPLTLADFKGKYVLLDFWASWCVPCRQGNPHMIALYNQYKSKGFDIIGIADDDTKPELWKGVVAKDNISIWHHVLRGLDMNLIRKHIINPNDLDTKYGIHSLPTKILINPQGKIIGRFGDSIGGTDEDMDKMLAGIFK